MSTSALKYPPRYRPSFTLVELLVAIAIIGTMAGMVLFSLAGARTDANIQRTRGTISKLNNIILQEWEKFRYRAARIEISPEMLRPMTDPTDPALVGQPPLSPREGARLRMLVLRDLMRMELPDRLTDVLYPPTAYKAALFTANNSGGDTSDDTPYYSGPLPGTYPGTRIATGKYNNYRTRLGLGAIPNPYSGPVTPVPATLPAGVNVINQGAEWLYQIVASTNYQGGSALELFRASEIGDTDDLDGDGVPDGDGMPEFLDAWGNPIRWIRWPAGFESPLNDTTVPDAMDPLRTDWRWPGTSVPKPWLLVPLIVSAGPDEVFDLQFDFNSSEGGPIVYALQTWSGTTSPAHAAGGPYHFIDPYISSTDASGPPLVGSREDEDMDGSVEGASDNVTNYDLILE